MQKYYLHSHRSIAALDYYYIAIVFPQIEHDYLNDVHFVRFYVPTVKRI